MLNTHKKTLASLRQKLKLASLSPTKSTPCLIPLANIHPPIKFLSSSLNYANQCTLKASLNNPLPKILYLKKALFSAHFNLPYSLPFRVKPHCGVKECHNPTHQTLIWSQTMPQTKISYLFQIALDCIQSGKPFDIPLPTREDANRVRQTLYDWRKKHPHPDYDNIILQIILPSPHEFPFLRFTSPDLKLHLSLPPEALAAIQKYQKENPPKEPLPFGEPETETNPLFDFLDPNENDPTNENNP